MRSASRLWFVWLFATAALVIFGRLTGGAQAPAVPALFGPPAPGARVPAVVSQRVDTLQARPVALNAAAVMAPAFDVELEPGRVVRATLDRRDVHRNGTQVWVGHVPGDPLSSVTLAWRDGVVQGSIRLLDAAFSIEPTGTPGVHVLRQVDTSAARPELEPLIPEDPLPAASEDPGLAADDGSTFDVVVFYTDAAAAAASAAGTAVETRIALGVSETNTAYANSGVIPRLRLVGTQHVSYTESGNSSTDLSRFRIDGDGYMDEVHLVRNALGADLAVLVVGFNTDACGVGYVMGSASSAFAAWAFSLSVYDCISPNYTFAHELGHNLGSAHAPEDGAGQTSLYPYSFGYKHPSNLFRTVMAYNCSGGCPRVLRFSTPLAAYNGSPTGVASQHDNAQSINNARNTIANWRQAISGSNVAPTITALGNVTINEDGVTSPLAFTVDDAETAASSLVVTAASANGVLVPNSAAALALDGSGASRTLTVTPAANASGTAAITVTVSDGALTASRTFTLTVTAVNDAPQVSRSPASATIASGTSTQTTVTVSDVDTAGSSLTLTAISSNPALLPSANVTTTITGTTSASRTFQAAMTPVPGMSGSAIVTFTGSDGAAQGTTTFALTVSTTAPSPEPGPPGNFLVSFSGRTVFMSWSPPTTGDPVTSYTLEAGSGPGLADLVVVPLGTATSFSAGGVPDGIFWLRVRAANASGVSPASNEVGVSMRPSGGCVGLPLPITFHPATVSGNNVGLSWSAPPPGPGPSVTSYVLFAGTQSGLSNITVFDTGSTALGLGAAAPSGVYYLRGAARNACGVGGVSNEVIVAVP